MDVIIVSNNRPQRLAATLGTVLIQSVNEDKRLILIDNSMGVIVQSKPISKLLEAFKLEGWEVSVRETDLKTISQVKHYAYQQGNDEIVIAIDNDVLFVRHDTLASMAWALRHYEIGAVSPLAYDIDNERPILGNDQHYYHESTPDENGVAEGLTALGLCLGFRRCDLDYAMRYWCLDFPYLEDQIIVHFIKRRRGYAHLHRHIIYHVSIDEQPSYVFCDEIILAYLEEKAKHSAEYMDILHLRQQGEDAAAFAKAVVRNEE